MSINAGRRVCLWKQGATRADKPIHMEFQTHLLGSSRQTPFMPPQGTSCDSLFPQKSITVVDFFPFTRRSSSWAQGKQWESLEQAAPLVAESFPHPRRSPNLSQSVLLWLLLSRLLLCSCPAPQPKPCSHPRHLSFGTQTDLLTCEQLLLKNR